MIQVVADKAIHHSSKMEQNLKEARQANKENKRNKAIVSGRIQVRPVDEGYSGWANNVFRDSNYAKSQRKKYGAC